MTLETNNQADANLASTLPLAAKLEKFHWEYYETPIKSGGESIIGTGVKTIVRSEQVDELLAILSKLGYRSGIDIQRSQPVDGIRDLRVVAISPVVMYALKLNGFEPAFEVPKPMPSTQKLLPNDHRPTFHVVDATREETELRHANDNSYRFL